MFVLDASALAKSFLDEDRSDELRAWLRGAQDRGEPLRTPPIAFSELGRVIQKECRDLTAAQRHELHQALFLGIEVLHLDLETSYLWTVAAVAAGTTYYDAEYVAAAHKSQGTLVSADEGQLAAARKAGVKTLSFSPKGRHAKVVA
jgi:predicted nucleic acid-binding protein